MQEENCPIIVGRISGVFGVRGWLKIRSFTRPKQNIFTYSPWLVHIDNAWQKMILEESQQRGERLLVKMTGIESPEKAREYMHCDLAVTRGQLPPLKQGEYYWHDLIGLEVFNQAGVGLGKIGEIVETGANDVLVVNKTGEVESKTLIPLVMDVYVKQVDLIARSMQVEWQVDE